jgi:hypothetical protein
MADQPGFESGMDALGRQWWDSPGGIRSKYTESSRYFRSDQYTYNVNSAFVSGNQWLWYDTQRNTVQQLPRDPARTRVTMNRLKPASRHIIARIMSRSLAFEVPPTDSDDATTRGALTAKSVVSGLAREHNWEDHKEQTAWNLWLGGTAGLCVEWDAGKGTPLGTTESGTDYGTGDLCEYPLSILEMCWEPGVRDAEKAYWWIRAQALAPAEVKRAYGLSYLPQGDATGVGTPFTQYLMRQDRGDTPTDLCLVLTLYMRPNKDNPRGTVATVIGGKFVGQPKPWSFPWKDRLNLVIFRETKIPTRATGETTLSAAVPVQTAFNAAWSNIIEHLKLAGSARMLIPESALDGIDELTDLPGELVLYNAASGGKPEWMTPAPMPQWVLESPERLASQMDDILGLHDVSQGKAPRNIESGVGISVLVEQDSTPIGQIARELAHGFERFGKLCLKLYEVRVTEGRSTTIKAPGQNAPETVRWTGADLMGQTDVEVPIDQVMPRSRTAMLAFARELWDRQIIATPEQFAKVADLPDQDSLLESVDPDAAKAMRENHDMSIGTVPVPAPYDNHATHITRHNTFRKTRAYESLGPDLQHIVDQHVQAHETLAAEAMGRQVAAMNIHPGLAGAANQNETPPPAMPGMPPPAPGAAPGGSSGPNYPQPMQPIEPRDSAGTSGAIGAPGGGI